MQMYEVFGEIIYLDTYSYYYIVVGIVANLVMPVVSLSFVLFKFNLDKLNRAVERYGDKRSAFAVLKILFPFYKAIGSVFMIIRAIHSRDETEFVKKTNRGTF